MISLPLFSSSSSSSFSRLPQPPEPQRHLPMVCVSMVASAKKKNGAKLVRLVSTAETGFFYVFKKTRSIRNKFGKLEFRKFDPVVRRHVLFTEANIK